jgi:hypothetical protein
MAVTIPVIPLESLHPQRRVNLRYDGSILWDIPAVEWPEVNFPPRRNPSMREPVSMRTISLAGDFSRLDLSPIHTSSILSPMRRLWRPHAIVSTSDN